MEYDQICRHFLLVVRCTLFETMYFILFYSVNVQGNGTHLAEKNPQPVDKINIIFRLS